jgi:hypothetical protein
MNMSRFLVAAALLSMSTGFAANFIGTNVNSSVAQEVEALMNLKGSVVRTGSFVANNKGLALYAADATGNPIGFQVVGVDMESKSLHVLGARSTPGMLQRVSGDALRYAQSVLGGN